MRILLLNYEYPPVGGGGGVASRELAEGWVKHGHQVTVLTSLYRGLPRSAIENGVKVFRVPVLGRKSLATASTLTMASFLASAFLFYCLRRMRFDLISTHFSIPTGPLGWLVSLLSKKPNVLSIYGADIYDPTRFSPNDSVLLSKVNSALLNSASAVIAESSDIRNNAYRYYNVKRDVGIVPVPYSKVEFAPADRAQLCMEKEHFYIISVGRLVKRKGFGNLIKAFALLEGCEIRLLIIGDGPESSSLRALIADLGLEGRVHLMGYQSHEKKFQYLQNSDLYVLASEHEGFGIVLQEAMQVGLPIVSTNVGGQVDFLADGENALLVPPRDARQLATAISELKNNASLRRAMAEKNKNDINRFAADIVSDQYLKVFEGVTNG